ncbi:MAG: Hpt domain-containing protein [Nitrospirae bacterium]|nr:Hpt domain-containing protein [Nitrospirota bacterium]
MEKETKAIVVKVDEELKDIVPDYLSKMRVDIKLIKSGLSENDMEKIRVVGHQLKGSGGGYGFDYITEVGMAIEKAAKASDAQEILKQVQLFTNFLDQVEVVYE